MGLFDRLKRSTSPENPGTSLANPATWLIHFMGGGTPVASGVPVNEESAMGVPALYACVRIIAEGLAALPLQVFENTDNGKRIAREHPVYPIVHDVPNDLQTSYYFREGITAQQCLWGNGYAFITRNPGTKRPVSMVPIKPENVTPVLDGQTLIYKVKNSRGHEEVIEPENMLHFAALGFDGVIGKSPIQLHREAIGLAKATELHGATFFKNGARLSGLLKHPNTFTSSEVSERIKAQFKKTYTESDWGIAMLEEGMDFQSLTMPNDDAQFLETRKMQIDEIGRIFRIPRSMLGEGDERKANVEQQAIDFVVHTMRPWLVRQEQEYNRKLFMPSERGRFFVEHNLDGLLRGDSVARAQFYKEMFMLGAFSQNMILEKENMNPIEGGDRHYVPLNMVPIDKVDAVFDEGELSDDDNLTRTLLRKAGAVIVRSEIARIERLIPLLDGGHTAQFAASRDRVKAHIKKVAAQQIQRIIDGTSNVDDHALAIAQEWVDQTDRDLDGLRTHGDTWRGAFKDLFEEWRAYRAEDFAETALDALEVTE